MRVLSRKLIFVILFLVFICFIEICTSARILALLSEPFYSHQNLISSVIRSIEKDGHQVHLLSPEQDGEETQTNFFNLEDRLHGELFEIPEDLRRVAKSGKRACKTLIKLFKKAEKLHQSQPFDALLLELFNTDCGLGIGHRLGLPVIVVSTCEMMPWYWDKLGLYRLGDSVENLGYFNSPMKLISIVGHYLSVFLYKKVQLKDNKLLTERFGANFAAVNDLPPPNIVIINRYFGIHGERSLTPNVLEVGGIHISQDQKQNKTDGDLQRIMDQSQGIIYVSWGTVTDTNSINKKIKTEMLNAFKELKNFNLTILWKWEGSLMEVINGNIIRNSTFPQIQILNHPNTKLFWTHGGVASIYESIYCNVPMIVTPNSGDQFYNAGAVEYLGVAKVLKYGLISKDTILDSISGILNNEEITDKLNFVSKDFQQWKNILENEFPKKFTHLLARAIQNNKSDCSYFEIIFSACYIVICLIVFISFIVTVVIKGRSIN